MNDSDLCVNSQDIHYEDIKPIEVKSKDNCRSISLSLILNRYSSRYGIRMSLKNFGFENNIKSVPSYVLFCIK